MSLSPPAAKPKRMGNYKAGPGRPPGRKNNATLRLEEAARQAAQVIGRTLPGAFEGDAHAFSSLRLATSMRSEGTFVGAPGTPGGSPVGVGSSCADTPRKFCEPCQKGFSVPISSPDILPTPFQTTLMIADKGLLHCNWPADPDRRQRHLYDGYAAQEAGLKRRSTISHPRVEPHDLASCGAASV